MSYLGFDPYQIFEVEHRPCLILEVNVICGRNITQGSWDYLDTPDPYVKLRIRTAPEGRKQTTIKDNNTNPVWNETFTFLLDESLSNELEIVLMEANYPFRPDERLGDAVYDLKDLPRDIPIKKSFTFNANVDMTVDIEMTARLDQNPTLRYSLCLCDEEKEFLYRRRVETKDAMQKLLGDRGPETLDEIPNIAIIGSGGGFRAMVGLSGVIKALHDSGIMQCATYLSGLSGSSWYISTLYSHPDWPHMSPGDMQDELMNNIDSSLLWLLSPQGVYRYLDRIMKKRQNGQPVSFTDFFGHMVGETLLKGRLDCKLTDQKLKIANGKVPMPLLTAVHVKKDRSARSFQEWVEFSPYEIGISKYGTFMPTELFGSKFFMGKLCKRFEEPPLHFLQGIWGSAFCILFKRLMEDNRRLDPVEMIRLEMEKQLDDNEQDESSDSSDEGEVDERDGSEMGLHGNGVNGNSNNQNETFTDATRTHLAVTKSNMVDQGQGRKRQLQRMISNRRTKQKGYWNNFLKGIFENKRFELLNTRAGRAGVIHNFMRGLSLQQSFPFSPFSPVKKEADEINGEEDDANRLSEMFAGMYEMHPTNVKHLYVVDAGLTFNSPYPLVLRPQREVDIVLSFDFSARPSDSTPPFKELLLAEQWAKKQKVPFPPIDVSVFDREGMKEMYIFKHPTDPTCPVVLHFVLINLDFRKFIKPGVRRKTEEEKSFAQFDIFDDEKTPYSTFNFKYSHQAFQRLSQLTEFNTLANIEAIKDTIAKVIAQKRITPTKCPCKLEDIPKLRRVSQKNKNRLSRFVSRVRSGRYSISEAKKDIDKPLENDSPIVEEKSFDIPDGPEKPTDSNKLFISRKTAIRKTTKTAGNGNGFSAVSIDPESKLDRLSQQSVKDSSEHMEAREIPGRRRPIQPDSAKLWQDSKCNSIDEGDQFFSAVGSLGPPSS